MQVIVSYYLVHWDFQSRRGYIDLIDSSNNSITQIPATSPEELAALHALLSASNETTFDPATNDLSIGQLPAGQGIPVKT